MDSTQIIKIVRYIESHSEEDLTLKKLAAYFTISAYHLQRSFKATVGLSPKEYLSNCRLKKLKQNLRNKKSITDSVYEVGYGSSSRLYEKIDSKLGMTPKDYQNKGKGLIISWEIGKTSLGKVMIAATDRGICFVQFGDGIKNLFQDLQKDFPKAKLSRMDASQKNNFIKWMKILNSYLNSENKKLTLPLDLHGTTFQIKVWKYLQKIPHGKTLSYTELAKNLGCPNSARAVASACARNKIALIIPCHRVLRGDGNLAGYRWGLERKEKLLTLEFPD